MTDAQPTPGRHDPGGCQRATYPLGYEIPCGFPTTHRVNLDDRTALLCETDAALFEQKHPGRVTPLNPDQQQPGN